MDAVKPSVNEALPRVAPGAANGRQARVSLGRSDPVGTGQAERMTVHHVDFAARAGKVRELVALLPRPIRLIMVGCPGLAIDLALFTAIVAVAHHPLVVRLGTLPNPHLGRWRCT